VYYTLRISKGKPDRERQPDMCCGDDEFSDGRESHILRAIEIGMAERTPRNAEFRFRCSDVPADLISTADYAYSARLLLFACSCASSDSAALPFR
jgi:hypothetical protein